MKKFLLLAAETTLVLLLFWPHATTAYENVLDINGKPVLAKTSYYTIPMNRTQGGGITLLSKSSNSPCPFHVALDPSKDSRGTPLQFRFFRNDDKKNMFLDVDINVVFDFNGKKCPEPKGWRLATGSTSYVTTGGEIGLIFQEMDWFKIKKAGSEPNVYKFVWCPEFMGAPTICLNLGVVTEGGNSFIGVRSEPLLVQFVQA
ncbi:kunitz trypsin inhibitor 5-like [Silene latifolia]|uniref:kunitz trypsin inhibitor 5-like n=1 Tax=Silene latifolia TaxID=37657 RepID=UPI003D776C43